MLLAIKQLVKNIPITLRITLWYSFFILGFLSIIIGISLFVADEMIEDVDQKKLIKSVEKIVNHKEKFEPFDDGIFFIKYNTKDSTIDGLVPKLFDPSLQKTNGKIQSYKNGKNKFYYYDSVFEKNPTTWVRGVIMANGFLKTISNFLIVLAILLPILFLFVLYGGYKIIKNAFVPVKIMSQTALEIEKSRDFSKRIDIPNGKDELHRLARVFNSMLDSLEKIYKNEKQLTSDISHELRTPTSIILAESDYGLEYAQNLQESKDSLKVIKRQSQKIALLIEQILELSRMEKLENLNLEKINLSQIVDNLAKDYEKIIEEKSINLSLKIEPNIEILGDELMIIRVVNNLLNNAIKFTKDKIEINLTKLQNKALLEIIDNGCGVSQSDKELIWNKFYQVSESRNKDINSGNGLGLSIVKEIIKAHNANINLYSTVGKGSKFAVEFQILK